MEQTPVGDDNHEKSRSMVYEESPENGKSAPSRLAYISIKENFSSKKSESTYIFYGKKRTRHQVKRGEPYETGST